MLRSSTSWAVRGLALARIRERREAGRTAVTSPVPAVVEEQRCTACGLCVSVCPVDCIRQVHYEASSKP